METAQTTLNQEIIRSRSTLYDSLEGPRIGDYIKLPNDQFYRITNFNRNNQFGIGTGSYFLGEGHLSFSGTANDWLTVSDIKLTAEQKAGSSWIFDQNKVRAGGRVDFQIPFRVYELVPEFDPELLYVVKNYNRMARRALVEQEQHYTHGGTPYTLPLAEIFLFKADIPVKLMNQLYSAIAATGAYIDATYDSCKLMIQPFIKSQFDAIIAICRGLSQEKTFDNDCNPILIIKKKY